MVILPSLVLSSLPFVALIFVVDSSDRERIPEAKQELMRLATAEELKNVILLVYANKNDLPNCVSAKEMESLLDLPNLKIPWMVKSISALNADHKELTEGLDWIHTELKNKKY